MRATAFNSFGDGWFPDVALGDGLGWLIARLGDPKVPGPVSIFQWAGTDVQAAIRVFSEALPGETPAYAKVHRWRGVTWFAYQVDTVLHLRSLDGRVHETVTAHNGPPCLFAGDTFVWQGAAPDYALSAYNLDTGAISLFPGNGRGTGLSRLDASGAVVLFDDDDYGASATPGQRESCYAGDVAVGEGLDDALLGARWVSQRRDGLVWQGQPSFRPRAALEGDRVALTAGGGRFGIRLFCGSHDELFALQPVVKDPPPPPPPDKEPPVTELRRIAMPNRIPQIVDALYELHKDLMAGDDDQRRQLQILVCEQARYELGPAWGAKRGDPGRPISKDSIAKMEGTVLYSADCFSGTTRKPAVPDYLEEIPGQTFQPVDPINHLSVDPPPPQGGGGGEKPPADQGAIVAAVVAQVVPMVVQQLKAMIPTIDTQFVLDKLGEHDKTFEKCARKGDSVTVALRVPKGVPFIGNQSFDAKGHIDQ